MKKIFITGGHFAPAKAVIQELSKRASWEIFYLGRKHSMEDDKAVALEYSEIQAMQNVTYLTITTGRLQRQFFVNVFQSVKAVLKVVIGLTQSPFWLIKYRPNVILSFGGYVAVPVVFWAWVFRLKIFTHEQTTVYGRSNKFISLLADKILVSWPESLQHFPANRVILTGNPLREEILRQRPTANDQRPTIYVTGGSQGAHVINIAIEKILPELVKKYQVIYQTGDAGRYHDYERLVKLESKRYIVRRQFSGLESADALAKATLIISRAGANTVCEILALGKMAILIPLPYSFEHEQEKNGQMVAGAGLGEVLPQEDLTPKKLLSLIEDMLTNKDRYLSHVSSAKKLVSLSAAQKIVEELGKT
ncbi:MAG: UDP-N-acetylglucosamine--N-acetylmuramyl-(pentapeptide) pyrophosphoryl-undecaprenol N-acetylglucosamine transferase [Patescibacteria group bacterium]|nr:UDP-N-acetylglucosamine--N-acetylmuramyl-(pentapeptide) pyrophosphoryl-undecaprenol N-acetylglucosamine transferase [Patescibacteria group bacterium]MCL5431736.1 UDP-N-acetylglucosamine--N-acetylmuramyl-(pentapeptide) pyrophosphoryl-undecaprenol N-acetylglucosamine transferase [Patescibacteria group bacterium]